MSIKIIAFDLDGTFLYDDKSVPAENIRALQAAAEQGAIIVPASGRTYTAMPPEITGLPGVRYFIGANGAEVYDAKENKCIYTANIPLSRALEVYSYADGYPIYYDCYLGNRGYMTRYMYDDIQSIVDIPGILHIIKTIRIPVDNLPDYLRERGDDLQKVQFYVRTPEEKAHIMAEMRELFPDLCVTSSLPMNIEINDRHASKGQALTALCEHLGIDRSQSIAFGDGSNDTDMLVAAGIGVAMANAEDEVKAAADYITESNMDDGFAKALLKFL